MFSKVRIKFSGVNSNTATGDVPSSGGWNSYAFARTRGDTIEYRDGQMSANYLWGISDFDYDFDTNKSLWGSYKIVQDENSKNLGPIALNYNKDSTFRIGEEKGLYPLTEEGNKFSFYRREYQQVGRYGDTQPTIIKGEWEPVAIDISSGRLRDFNVANGRSYQYVMYPNQGTQVQQFANANMEDGTSSITGDPVRTCWSEWSICELTPVTVNQNIPIIKKSYKVDLDNVWLFKYNLETGSQTQNLTKNEYKTLGQFSRFGYGPSNSISGDVSCLLGSEMIPYSKYGYYERLWKGIDSPSSLSTNQKVDMLNQWRSIAFSKNPKLLKDMKGQLWVVQILSNSNTPKNFYKNQPDTISFSWKQIDDPEGCLIYGDGDLINKTGDPATLWYPWEKIQQSQN